MDKVFKRVSQGKDVLLGVVRHDYRSMAVEVEDVRRMLKISSKRYPGIQARFSEANRAFRDMIYGGRTEDLVLTCELEKSDKAWFQRVDSTIGKVFGPKPFLAVKLRGGGYLRDNLDFDLSLTSWPYSFDRGNIWPEDLESIGLAANDKYGNTVVEHIRVVAS